MKRACKVRSGGSNKRQESLWESELAFWSGVQEGGRKSPPCSISSLLADPEPEVRRMLHLTQAMTSNSESASHRVCYCTFQCRRNRHKTSGWMSFKALWHSTFGSSTTSQELQALNALAAHRDRWTIIILYHVSFMSVASKWGWSSLF